MIIIVDCFIAFTFLGVGFWFVSALLLCGAKGMDHGFRNHPGYNAPPRLSERIGRWVSVLTYRPPPAGAPLAPRPREPFDWERNESAARRAELDALRSAMEDRI